MTGRKGISPIELLRVEILATIRYSSSPRGGEHVKRNSGINKQKTKFIDLITQLPVVELRPGYSTQNSVHRRFPSEFLFSFQAWRMPPRRR